MSDKTIFISRAGEDREVAIEIEQLLSEAGYATFLQDKDFGHASFMERMAEGFRHIDAGGVLVALLSHHYLAKPHCLKEARYPLNDDAANTRERLIVLRLDDCEPTDWLKDIPFIDIGREVLSSAELAEVVIPAVQRSLRNQVAPPATAREDPKIEQIMLFLENEDYAGHGQGLKALGGFFL